MVRRIFSLLVLSFCFLPGASPAQAQDARPSANPNDPGGPVTPKKDLCSVSGTVVALAGGEPLRKVRVRLENSDDRTKATAVTTNVDGHFEFKGVDPGRYRLTVSRVSYVTQTYGQRKPQDPGAILTLRPAQEMKDLVFKMISAAVIAGRIVDEDGEPLPSVSVSAMKELYDHGKRTLLPAFSIGSAVESNDLGEYRLYGLPPGRYFISAVYNLYARSGGENPSDTQQVSSQGYARMFYPGTADRAKASSITVKAGEEVPSVEIMMRQVVVYHVRGRIFNQITHRPGKDCYVFLMAKGGSYFSSESYAQVEKPDGSFDIPEVLPGSYAMVAMWFDQGKNYASRVSVDVGNADVEGVGITLGQGVAVNGRVVWDGKPSLEKDDLTIGLSSTDHTPAMENGARVNSDGSFTLEQVSDGSYDVSPNGQSKDCYLKNVEYAGSSALDDGFTLARGSAAGLEVTLSSRGARVQGAATDEDSLPAAGVWVALVPDSEARRAKHRLYKSQTTDQYGHFDLHGIAPGDYRLFSWSQADEGAWEDPEFIQPLLDKNRGEKISVQEGDTKTVNVLAIPSEKTEQGKE